MSDIVIAEFMDERAVASLSKDFDTLYDPTLFQDLPRLKEVVKHARALIVRANIQVRDDLLAAGEHLKVAARLGVGLDNFDLPGCKARGIEVVSAAGANEVSVAEYVMASLFLLFRGAFLSTEAMRNGEWPRNTLIKGREISGKTLGIVGFGSIARQVAKRAQAMGMTVIAHNAFTQPDDPVWAETQVTPATLAEVMATSDAVTLHVPMNASTRGLISRELIATMKKDAVLINSARGGVVDDVALADALKAGRLHAAAVDVFEVEPLGADNPYHGVPNLVLTPHIAGTTIESNERVSSVVADKTRKALLALG